MINYKHIAEATKYYENCGYCNVDAPWFVSGKAISATAPINTKNFCTSHIGFLVGSGEQSFIDMYLWQCLSKGKYQCATPCFRDEPFLTEFTHNYFFKVELIDLFPDSVEQSLSKMITDAAEFFNSKLKQNIQVIETDIGFDIEWRGIELGSYGYREFQDMKWVYGTGCAEPRLSQVIKKEELHPLF